MLDWIWRDFNDNVRCELSKFPVSKLSINLGTSPILIIPLYYIIYFYK